MIVDLAHVIGVLMQPRHVERRRVLVASSARASSVSRTPIASSTGTAMLPRLPNAIQMLVTASRKPCIATDRQRRGCSLFAAGPTFFSYESVQEKPLALEKNACPFTSAVPLHPSRFSGSLHPHTQTDAQQFRPQISTCERVRGRAG